MYTSHSDISDEQLNNVRSKFAAFIAAKLPIEKVGMTKAEFIAALPDNFTTSKVNATRKLGNGLIPAFRIGSSVRWSHGIALSNTGDISVEDTFFSRPSNGDKKAFIVAFVGEKDYAEQPAIIGSTSEIIQWADHMEIRTISDLNALKSHSSEQSDFALHSEFRQDMKISDITNMVLKRGTIRLICIAGPTSSGKTTFATKLSMCLRNHGLKAIPLTVDHYYLPLDRQPKYQVCYNCTTDRPIHVC